ncbi:putative mechanosensitive ion channel MscS [Rosa chinensis]|uniref:Mechanosensitive ion channel protein n=1 Tax=Rosa chinensis TaxID=74649 RepID=A0A2P6PS73_ROSCH|nr:putative mechanosensitive ion channel MscS [Rosa chinensis]
MSEKQQSPNRGEVVVEVGREKSNEPKDSSASQTLTKRKSFTRSVVSKPKSRFGDPLPIMYEETSLDQAAGANSPNASFNRESPNEISLDRTESSSAKNAPPSPGRTQDEEAEEVYKTANAKNAPPTPVIAEDKRGKVNKKLSGELIVFLSILGCLVASLTIHKLKDLMVWGLEIWKWCVLVMVVSCGMLMTNWVMHFIVFLIERSFLFRKNVLYFVYGLKKNAQILMWVGLVLLTWLLLIKRGLQQSKVSTKILAYITRSIVAVVIGASLWLLKTLMVKILASKFQVVTYFSRIQESIFHQYALRTLSGPPLMEDAEGSITLSFTNKAHAAGKEIEVTDMAKLQKIKQEKVSSVTMKGLVDVVTTSGLSAMSQTLDEKEDLNEQRYKEITSETEATAAAAAYDIYIKESPHGAKYIEERYLLRFMMKEEVDLVWPLIDVAKTGQVDRKTLNRVKVYTARKALAHALSDTKAVTAQVDNLVSSIVLIIIIVVGLLVVEIATTSFFVFLSSQLVLAALAFGNTCKNVFESIMFLFVAHPYDVGDCIVFEGVPMIVEEMNIFTTVFLKLSNNEKVYYPNSVLSATSISNYSRSPDMRDAVEFSIALTPVEKIVNLKEKIKEYIEGKPQYWHRKHNVAVIDIEDVDKLKMAVYCQHKMNFQDFEEKNLRRAKLNFELLKILEELNITVISAVLPKSESHPN